MMWDCVKYQGQSPGVLTGSISSLAWGDTKSEAEWKRSVYPTQCFHKCGFREEMNAFPMPEKSLLPFHLLGEDSVIIQAVQQRGNVSGILNSLAIWLEFNWFICVWADNRTILTQ